MSVEDDETIDSTNDTTEEVANTEEVEETVVDTETEDKPQYTEFEKKQHERAKLAEAEAKKLREELKTLKAKSDSSEKQDGLTPMDTLALFGAKVTIKEDIETVQKYARAEGISIEKALDDEIVQGILKARAEQRQTANATNTGTARRGSAKLSDEQILANVHEGKFPEDPVALAEARMNAKKAKK